jgi:hypothetical protein
MRTQHDHSVTCPGIIAFTAARWKFNEFLHLLVIGAIAVAPVFAATPVVEGPKPPVQTNQPAAPAATPVPPPSAPPKLSAAELEKLLMPIALYPDPLLATILPASVYPLEIVQAARFLQDSNNVSKIDQQNWDESVKAVAKIPAALKKLNDDLPWTIQLGEVFLSQDKDVMDMIQSLRNKAQTAGTLRTTEQQTIVVTNMVVEKTVEQQVVVVTNTIVQIQPSNPQTVYVPTYPPTVYYPPPAYVYNPYAPLITFGAGVAMGAIIANNCDWHGGGCYWGGHGDVNIDRDTNINIDRGDRTNVRGGDRTSVQGGNRANTQGGKKWQPDQNRVKSSGSAASTRTMESRGYGSGTGGAGAQRANTTQAGGRGQAPTASTRPAGGAAAARPSTPSANTRPSTPSANTRPSTTPSAGNRAPASPSAGTRPAASPSVGNNSAARSPSASPAASTRSGGSSAFSGGGNSSSVSQRGSASRGGGGFSGGGGGGRGGGGRGGGGGGRR